MSEKEKEIDIEDSLIINKKRKLDEIINDDDDPYGDKKFKEIKYVRLHLSDGCVVGIPCHKIIDHETHMLAKNIGDIESEGHIHLNINQEPWIVKRIANFYTTGHLEIRSVEEYRQIEPVINFFDMENVLNYAEFKALEVKNEKERDAQAIANELFEEILFIEASEQKNFLNAFNLTIIISLDPSVELTKNPENISESFKPFNRRVIGLLASSQGKQLIIDTFESQGISVSIELYKKGDNVQNAIFCGRGKKLGKGKYKALTYYMTEQSLKDAYIMKIDWLVDP